MKKFKVYLFFSLLLFAITLASCTSTTMITSEPTGAKVFLNDAYVGNTPYAMSDKNFATECTAVSLEKDGHEILYTIICRDEEINMGAAIGGLFVWPLWFWVFDYYPEHNYILKPLNSNNLVQKNDNYDNLDYTVDDQTQGQNNQQSAKVKKLIDLKDLYDRGILSKKEYEEEKQKILEEDEW